MPRNGSGTYTRPQADYVPGTTILATSVNSDLNDMAQALTTSIARDGQTIPTANMPMGNFRHTGVSDGTARTDYAALGQTQNGAFLWGGTAGGTANALTVSLNPPITAYAAGQKFRFISGASANTGAVTLNVNSLGAVALNKGDGTIALGVGDIPASAIIEALYDGTRFRLASVGAGLPSGLIYSAAFSAVSNIDIALPSIYKFFEFRGFFTPGTNQAALILRTSTTGAAPFDSGASDYVTTRVDATSGAVTPSSATLSYIQLTQAANNAAGQNMTFSGDLTPADGTNVTRVNSRYGGAGDTGGGAFTGQGFYHGLRSNATAVTALRFAPVSGTMTGRLIVTGYA